MNRFGLVVVTIGILAGPAPGSTFSGPRFLSQIFPTTLIAQGRSTIYGTVYGDDHRPVSDVYVELLDDVNSSINQVKTDASGRFSFSGLPDGRYQIKVRPLATDYFEQTLPVTISAVSAASPREGARLGGSSSEHIDIALKRNERATAGPFSAAPFVIFAQDIPSPAKKLYDEGVAFLREKKETEGFASLRKAIEIFPDYYLALDRLGAEYAMKGTANRNYLEAGLVLLAKAVEINPRGFSSRFGLGWTQYQLGMNAEAVANLKLAVSIYEKAPDAHLWLGKALKRAGTLNEAETAFKRANELNSGKVADVHWQMAQLYGDQKRYKEAADELELFLKADPKAGDAEKIKAVIKQLREKADMK